MKPAHKLGFKFRFLYHIIYAASSLSRGEERKKVSKRESVTHDCERTCEQRCHDREPLVARASEDSNGSRHRHLSFARHAHSDARTLTSFAFFPAVFEEKRGRSQSTLRTITKFC